MSLNDKPHFAVPEDNAVRVGETSDEAPSWGDDAKEIAKEAGLGSYGDTVEEVESSLDDFEDRLHYVEGRLVLIEIKAVKARLAASAALVLCVVIIVYLVSH